MKYKDKIEDFKGVAEDLDDNKMEEALADKEFMSSYRVCEIIGKEFPAIDVKTLSQLFMLVTVQYQMTRDDLEMFINNVSTYALATDKINAKLKEFENNPKNNLH